MTRSLLTLHTHTRWLVSLVGTEKARGEARVMRQTRAKHASGCTRVIMPQGEGHAGAESYRETHARERVPRTLSVHRCHR